MAGPHRLGYRACGLEHADRTTHVVRRARPPRIAVPADDHQLVRKLAPANDAERVVDRLRAVCGPIIRHLHARTHRTGAHVVAEGQSALPALRDAVAAQSLEQFARIPVRDGNNGDVRNLHPTLGKPWRSRLRCIPRRGRIAVDVHHAAPLHAVAVAHRAIRIDVATHVAVLLRIAVDEQRHGAVLLGLARLDAAERPSVPRHGNLPAHGDAERVELRVVLDQAVVHVDHVRRHVTLPAVAVHRWILRQGRCRVTGDRRLGERQLLHSRRHAPHPHRRRVRQEHVVLPHLRLEAHRLHLRDHVIARARLRRGARHVRLGREHARVRARPCRIRSRDRVRFERPLGRGGRRGVSRKGRALLGAEDRRSEQCENDGQAMQSTGGTMHGRDARWSGQASRERGGDRGECTARNLE